MKRKIAAATFGLDLTCIDCCSELGKSANLPMKIVSAAENWRSFCVRSGLFQSLLELKSVFVV